MLNNELSAKDKAKIFLKEFNYKESKYKTGLFRLFHVKSEDANLSIRKYAIYEALVAELEKIVDEGAEDFSDVDLLTLIQRFTNQVYEERSKVKKTEVKTVPLTQELREKVECTGCNIRNIHHVEEISKRNIKPASFESKLKAALVKAGFAVEVKASPASEEQELMNKIIGNLESVDRICIDHKVYENVYSAYSRASAPVMRKSIG